MATQSKVGSVTLMTTPATNVGPFAAASDSEVTRIFIRNTGAVLALISYASSPLNGAISANSTSDRFPLSVGQEMVFIAAPRQALYAIGVGAGGELAYHVSPALPLQGV